MDEAEISARIQALKGRLEELERNKPAHGLKPFHIAEMEEIEDQIEELEKNLAGWADSSGPTPGQH